MGKQRLVGLLLAAWLASHALFAAVADAVAQESIVGRASVIDGDTIEVRGQRIRLHGIDAPEAAQTCRRDDREWRCGQAAALALSDWLGAATTTCQPVGRDRYGRTVGRCVKGGQDVAGWLVSQGWAMDWHRYSGGSYAASQDNAQRLRRGMWSGTFQPPWDWRRKN